MTTKSQFNLSGAYTVAEFMELDYPPDANLYELWEGKIIVSPPPGDAHAKVNSRLDAYLTFYVLENKLGEVWSNGTFQLDAETALAPDVAFIRTARLLPTSPKAVPIPPDLAIEIQSPGDTLPEMTRKVQKYLECGVSLVWLVRPAKKTVLVYDTVGQPPKILGLDDTLDGGTVVDGFTLEIKKLFDYK